MHRFSLFVLGLLSLGQTALAAGPDAPAHLALWRSYTGGHLAAARRCAFRQCAHRRIAL